LISEIKEIKMPNITETVVDVELSPQEKIIYENCRNNNKIVAQRGTYLEVLVVLLRLRQIACHPGIVEESFKETSSKVKAGIELCNRVGGKTIVFTNFIAVLDYYEDELAKIGVKSFKFHGGMTQNAKNKALGDFKEFQGKAVLLMSSKSGSKNF
jgi:SNF2 family DNA or RNA helicase